MQALRQHLLAGAALAQQHHGGVAAGHLLDGAADAQHLGVARDQARQRIGLVQLAQAAVLGLQLGQAEGALDRQAQQLGLEGLGKEVVGAQGHRAQALAWSFCPVSTMTLMSGSMASICSSSLKPSDTRVGVGRQAQVHRHHGRLVAAQLHQRALAVAGGDRLEAVQRPLDLLLQRQVVLDDQQRTRIFLRS